MWGSVKNLAHFSIDIYKLSNKEYKYQYNLDEGFFGHFENSPLSRANLSAEVTLDKQESLITAFFAINGTVELECDRSLEKFDYPLSVQERVIYQYGEEEQELGDDIVIITNSTQSINVAQYIYEFVNLAIPMRKLHPKYQEDEDPSVDGEIIFSSTVDQSAKGESEQNKEESESVDPRWNALKNLKNLK